MIVKTRVNRYADCVRYLSILKELLTVTKKSQNARARCASAITSSA
jgi:hypothetical protein